MIEKRMQTFLKKMKIEEHTIKDLEEICEQFFENEDCEGCPLLTKYFCPIPCLVLMKEELKE